MTGVGEVRFIGVVESAGDTSIIHVYDEYCPGLLRVREYSHLVLLYWMHMRDNQQHRRVLQVTPHRHEGAPLTGVFACRSPSRPNPLGMTVVELVGVNGCRIHVGGLDALEGSPIVDIKPYLPQGDSFPDARTPDWTYRGPPT